MSCNPITDISGCLKEGITSGMDAIAQSFKDGAEWAIKNLTTAWLNAPSPDVNSSISVTGWIQSHLSYFVAATMVLSVLAAAYRMATTGKFEHGRDLGESLTRVLLVSVLAGTLTTLCVEVGEAFSTWILDKAQVDFSTTVVFAAVQSPGVIILLAIIVIIAQVIQLGLMLIRNAMIVILVGVLPLAAAAGNTQVGRQWWQKSFAWLLAFVLYKPVAALIYAASFKMASKDQDLATQLSGIFMMLLAIFALPALMRFMVPATAAMSGGNAGAMAGAVVGAAVATGAVLATGGAAGAAGGFGGASASGAASSSASTAPATTSGPSATGAAGGSGSPGSGGPGSPGSPGTGTPGASGSAAGGADGAPGLGGPGAAQAAPAASGAEQGTRTPGAAGGSSSSPPQGSASGGGTARNVVDAANTAATAARFASDTASGATGEQS